MKILCHRSIKCSKMTPKNCVSALMQEFGASEEAAQIVVEWYENEVALSDFSDTEEFAEFVRDDISDMLSAADDPDTIKFVADEFNVDVSWMFDED